MLKLRMTGVAIAILLASVSNTINAQNVEPSTSDDQSVAPVELSPITVDAPLPAPEDGRQSLITPTTGMSRELIEVLPNQRLGDVLQRLSGVTMGGAAGENKDVRLRGMDKEFTRTQFDGVALTDGGEKREFQVWRFPSALIGNVAVIRNPTAEYEADGIAGRIAVTTREIPKSELIEVETGIGSGTGLTFGDDRKLQALYGNRFEDVGLQVSFSHMADPIYKDKTKQTIGGNSESEGEEKRAVFNDIFADMAWFGDRHTLHVKPMLLNIDEAKDKTKQAFNAAGALNQTEVEDGDDLKRTLAVIVDHKFKVQNGIGLDTTLTFSDTIEDKATERTFTNGAGVLTKTETEAEDKKDETVELGSKLTIPFMLGVENEAKFGFAVRRRDRYRDKTKIENAGGVLTDKTVPKDSYSMEEEYYAGFVQDTLTMGDWAITPGLRFEHVIQKPKSGAGVSGKETISDLLPSLHGVYRPSDGLTFRASASRLVNRPKFDELAPFQEEKGAEVIEGNPNLQPARAWAFDVGADYATSDLFLGANVFHRQIKDVIENVDTGTLVNAKPLFRTENVGDGHVHGLELEQRLGLSLLGMDFLENVSLHANQTFIRSELENELGQTRSLKEQPGFIGNLSVIYNDHNTRTKLSLSGNYVSAVSKDEFSGKTDTVDPEFFLDGYAETSLYGPVSVFAWVENITGESRQKIIIDGTKTDIEQEDTGRAYFIGLKARF